MSNFFAELKRRHMYRVAAAYAVVAWVLLQIVNNLAPALGLPNWVAATVVVLLAIGFPVALLFSWIQHLAPATDAPAQIKTNRLDWILAGGLAAVIAIFLFQQIASGPVPLPVPRAGSISVAVLPFANLSGDAAQEFFSDGMTEEINAALSKVQGLTVLGRSSAFQFKGQNSDPREIGRALSATHLIEGSVRKAGDRVRITAQLVRSENGAQLWSETYDRQLNDIFAIQEDIAQAIAGALRVPLGLRPGETLVSNRDIDPESYQQYLRAKALVRSRVLNPLSDAAALLEQIVARHPDYAPAWALLALTYDLTPQTSPAWVAGSAAELRNVVDATQPKAEAAAQRAVELDRNLADGYLALALVQQRRGKFLSAEETFSKSLALDPNNPDVLQAYSNFLAGVGRLKEALAIKQRLHAMEPFPPVFTATTGLALWLNGEDGAAEAMTKDLPAAFRGFQLAQYYAAAGRYEDAAEALRGIPPGALPQESGEAAMRLLRAAPAVIDAREPLPRLGVLAFVYAYVGAPERALEPSERNLQAGYFQALSDAVHWHPSKASVRKTERFRAFVRNVGFVDYWRAKGWPEQCHPTTGDDFVCT